MKMEIEKLILRAPESALHFRRAAAASRAWSRAYSHQCDHYKVPWGTTHVSGIGQDCFPEHVKRGLAVLADRTRVENQAGMDARPRGMRQSTLLTLARAIVERDGGGYYGFCA